jgi:hypothetical protein
VNRAYGEEEVEPIDIGDSTWRVLAARLDQRCVRGPYV